MIKRILIIVSALSLLICFFAFPSYAATVEAPSHNLFITDYVEYSRNNEAVPYSGSIVPGSSNSFKWEVITSGTVYSHLDLRISCTVKPTSVHLTIGSDIIVGEYLGGLNGFYDYRFSVSRPLTEVLLDVNFSSDTPSPYLSINSFRGYFNDTVKAGFTTVRGVMQYNDKSSASTDAWQWVEFQTPITTSFPRSFSHRATTAGLNNTGRSWAYDIYYLNIATSSNQSSYYRELVVEYSTPCSTVNPDLAITYRQSGEEGNQVIGSIPYSESTTIEYYPMSDISINDITVYNDDIVYYHVLTFDVSQIDLNSYEFELPIVLNPTEAGRMYSQEEASYTFITFESAYFREQITEIPWYMTIGIWFRTNIDRLIKAIKGPESADDPLVDPGNQLATQASDFNDAVDVIESVTKPSIDLDHEMEQLPEPDPLVINTVQALTGDQFMIKLLIMAALLALVGIVLYGGKG